MIEPGANEEFLRFLAAQRVDYVRALPSKLAEVQRLWDAVSKGPAAPGELEGLVRAVHNLAGSGAVFGFEEFGAAAKSLELLLQALAESPERPQGIATVEDAIARLQSCAPGMA